MYYDIIVNIIAMFTHVRSLQTVFPQSEISYIKEMRLTELDVIYTRSCKSMKFCSVIYRIGVGSHNVFCSIKCRKLRISACEFPLPASN